MAGIQQQNDQESERERIGPPQTHHYRNLVNEMEETLHNLGPPLHNFIPPQSSECCIYKVPKELRKVNASAYTPQIVSIGPLHHGKMSLAKMENHKLRYLKNHLQPFGKDISKKLHNLVSYIKGKERSIRRCYAESFDNILSDQFVKMVLLDTAFIILLFMGKPMVDHDYDFNVLHFKIMQDLILLENQIPFFILEDLYDLAFKDDILNSKSFRTLTLDNFSYYQAYNHQGKPLPENINHFTDLLRYFLLPSQSPPQARPSQSCFLDCCKHLSKYQLPNQILHENAEPIFSATKLYEGGVKFKAKAGSMLDIKFSNGHLEMPCFKLYHNSESFIRNIMALEVCRYPYDAKICAYILLMDHLINTAEDVELLVKKKIMENWLGDHHAAATLVNKLRLQIPVMMDSHYSNIYKELNAYYEVPRHSWKATLLHEYFRSPWRAASTIAAIVLLVLTAIQTICSVISL